MTAMVATESLGHCDLTLHFSTSLKSRSMSVNSHRVVKLLKACGRLAVRRKPFRV